MRLPFILFCLTFYCNATAQPLSSYEPINDDYTHLQAVKNEIRNKYLKDSAAITGENKKYTLALYRERLLFLNKMFDEEELMSVGDINIYLNALVKEIILHNPVLQKSGTRFLFSRAHWPNAYSTGEGTIIFNIGLFTKLANESEAAFVLCHELAHLHLNHSNNSIDNYINTVYADDFQQKLKDIKNSLYEKNKQLDKLEKGIVFSSRRHGRQHEAEADSMAILFMKNTGFNLFGSLSCLSLLDTIDRGTYNTEAELQVILNFPEYPFQTNWIKKETAFFGVSTDKKEINKDADSLKTHPDCKKRIALLTPLLDKSTQPNTKKFLISEEQFNLLQQKFILEIIEFSYKRKNISLCLYQAMEQYKTMPDNVYITAMIGKCFNQLYENQKNHLLNTIVSPPSPAAEKNYNTLLTFIQNLRLSQIASLAYYFLKQHEIKFSTDKEFLKTYTQSKINFNNHN